jgi:hypothetical protein
MSANPTQPYVPRRPRSALFWLFAFATLALGGCESIMVMTGARMRLDGVPLQAIAASMPGNGGIAPGGKATLSVVATTTDGRTLATVGTGEGKVLLDSYRFEASVVKVNADGVVTLPADPHLSEGLTPHVRITAAGQTAPVADLDIPVRYDVAFEGSYRGRDGFDGMNGLDGMAGTSGSMGSFDPNNPSAGGDGGNGTNGSDGSDGDAGGRGPDVRVTIALVAGDHPLLHVRASESGKDHDFIVDPAGGSLTITASSGYGGRGGRGGQGGQGGAGGSGGSGSGASGLPGSGGRNGQDGPGGPAGTLTVAIDPAAAPYLDRFHFKNVTGDSRPGPAPIVTTAPVASPW